MRTSALNLALPSSLLKLSRAVCVARSLSLIVSPGCAPAFPRPIATKDEAAGAAAVSVAKRLSSLSESARRLSGMRITRAWCVRHVAHEERRHGVESVTVVLSLPLLRRAGPPWWKRVSFTLHWRGAREGDGRGGGGGAGVWEFHVCLSNLRRTFGGEVPVACPGFDLDSRCHGDCSAAIRLMSSAALVLQARAVRFHDMVRRVCWRLRGGRLLAIVSWQIVFM